MSDFIACEDRALLGEHGLASFEALWALKLEVVDEPNTERGGWSDVCRLELGERAYYLKRQSNHLTYSILHPFGEPTFAREFRNIQRYAALRIPALQAAFFGERKVSGELRAVLLTHALDGWDDLYALYQRWGALSPEHRLALLRASAELARRLHDAGQLHGCFYPKHIFLRGDGGGCEACLIDLEKTRPLLLGWRDRVKDLETLIRRADPWRREDIVTFVAVYLNMPLESAAVVQWMGLLDRRLHHKEAR
ncbi:lipopolysaccharide kinase InaA family protein [Ectopseudomonas alcaliphila]|uniref:lipopolysaccharide kinase InaA family protein n=1 Tax=Ectopseudomonas alcaliphila TaxID=101564 RepID=UPI0027875313|nr:MULTISPECIES: lipopolysaccharide kinase InaA family protein [Pseudomonas]MDP9938467.1 hypothetical protein [Pseudomonas sp. 3400]MDR7010690.1 hypothetical protein [Pseudomonas alcaliphila]